MKLSRCSCFSDVILAHLRFALFQCFISIYVSYPGCLQTKYKQISVLSTNLMLNKLPLSVNVPRNAPFCISAPLLHHSWGVSNNSALSLPQTHPPMQSHAHVFTPEEMSGANTVCGRGKYCLREGQIPSVGGAKASMGGTHWDLEGKMVKPAILSWTVKQVCLEFRVLEFAESFGGFCPFPLLNNI